MNSNAYGKDREIKEFISKYNSDIQSMVIWKLVKIGIRYINKNTRSYHPYTLKEFDSLINNLALPRPQIQSLLPQRKFTYTGMDYCSSRTFDSSHSHCSQRRPQSVNIQHEREEKRHQSNSKSEFDYEYDDNEVNELIGKHERCPKLHIEEAKIGNDNYYNNHNRHQQEVNRKKVITIPTDFHYNKAKKISYKEEEKEDNSNSNRNYNQYIQTEPNTTNSFSNSFRQSNPMVNQCNCCQVSCYNINRRHWNN